MGEEKILICWGCYSTNVRQIFDHNNQRTDYCQNCQYIGALGYVTEKELTELRDEHLEKYSPTWDF